MVKSHIENTIADFLANAHAANADEPSPNSKNGHSESDPESEFESVASPPSTLAHSQATGFAELAPQLPLAFSPEVAVRISGLASGPDAALVDPQHFGLSPVPPSGSASVVDSGAAKDIESADSHFAEDSELDMSYHSALEQQLIMDEASFVAQSRENMMHAQSVKSFSGTSEEADDMISSPQAEKKSSEIAPAANSTGNSEVLKEDLVAHYRVVYEHGAFVRDKPSRNANNLRLLDSGDVVAVTGKSFTSPENGVKYMELKAGGWVPFRTQAGHTVLELQADTGTELAQRSVAVDEASPIGDNQLDINAVQGKPRSKENEARGAQKRRLPEKVMQRQKTDVNAIAESAAIAENVRLKQLLVEQQRALQQAQSAAAAAEKEKAELEKAVATSKATASAEEDAVAENARVAALAQATAIKEAEEAAETAAEQQRLKEKAEHEQWLAEQRSVDVTQGSKTLERTEELYNRMRAATSAKKTTAKTDVINLAEMSSISIESFGFDPAALKVSSSFALTTKDTSMKSITSAAHDRLHRAAAVRIQNRVIMKDRLESRDEDYMTRNRFTMNPASKNIMENVKHTSSRVGENGEKNDDSDFLHRLYEDGRKAQMQRKITADIKEQAGLEPYKIEEWSCVRCGVFHTIDHNQLAELQREVGTSHRKHAAISAPAQSDSKEAARKANADAIQAAVKYHSKIFRCSTCGFERQDAIAPHKPLILALRSAEENGTAAQLLARRTQAIASSGGIVEYLRSKHLHAQGQLARQRREWDRKDQMLTFQPRINEISHQLVESKIQLCKAIENFTMVENSSQNSTAILHDRSVSSARIDASVDASLGDHGSFGNYLANVNNSAGAHRNSTIDRSGPYAANDANAKNSQDSARIPAEKRQQLQSDRAAWLHASTVQNKKLEKSVSYSHDSKPTSISEYFEKAVADRLSANIKPHIVKRKHENKNKYMDPIELYVARKSTSLTLEVEESKGGSDEDGTSGVNANDSATSDAHMHFVARQILWQRKNHASKDKLRHRLNDFDQSTQRPLYRPHLDPSPNYSSFTEPSIASVDVVHRLSVKDIEAKRRRAALVEEHLRSMEREQREKQVAALPQSTDILAKATERSIAEMFRSLLASVGAAENARASPGENIPQTRKNGDGIDAAPATCEKDKELLNLSLVQPKAMVPEAAELLLDVFSQKKRSDSPSAESKGTAWCVTFPEFRLLLLDAIERRGKDPNAAVLGRSYVHVPRKRPVEASKKEQEELAESTFTPAIDKGSTAILRNTGRVVDAGVNRNKQPVETKLLNQGRKMEGHKEELRKKKEEQEKKTLTFRPKLFKPPKSVVPHYRGSASAAPKPAPEPVPTVVPAVKGQSMPPFKPVLSGKTLAKVAAALRSPPRLAVNSAVPAAVSYSELYGKSSIHATANVPELPRPESVTDARPPPPPFPVDVSNAPSGVANLADSLLEMVKLA
jgi:hypothetical protein